MVRKESKSLTLEDGIRYSAIRTEQNRRTLGIRSYLLIYNLGRTIQKDSFPPTEIWKFFFPRNPLPDSIASFLVNELGEEPVLIDTAQLNADIKNLIDVYFSKGFFKTKVSYRLDTGKIRNNRKKAKVTFLVEEGPAAIINKTDFEVNDMVIRKIMSKTWDESFLRSGETYVEDNFVKERNRISAVMRENGFYSFSPKMVTFDVDTKPDSTELSDQEPANRAITNFFPIFVTLRIDDPPSRYEIGEVSMIIEPAFVEFPFDSYMLEVDSSTTPESIEELGLNPRLYDPTISFMSFRAYPRTLATLNLNFLEKHVELKTGQKYSLSDERKTQQRLQNLGIFKYVLVKHEVDDSTHKVNVTIQAVLLQKYQIKAGTEGFWESDPFVQTNFPGVGIEFGFRDQMLFKGAEQLDLSVKGNMSFFRPSDTSSIDPFLEGTAQANLQFPRALIPFVGRKNLQRYNPRTSLVTTFSRQQTFLYSRNNLTLDYNYSWYHSSQHQKASSKLSPLTVTLVSSKLKPEFVQGIAAIEDDGLRRLIAQDYRPRFSTYSQYKFTYSNYMSTRKVATYFIQPTIEIGGNIPYLFDRFFDFGKDKVVTDQAIRGIFYGQYYKASIEIKNFLPLGKGIEFVMRNYFGVAVPWNFTGSVPLESRFFGGGANTMRGWQSNTLGPGTYVPTFDPEAENTFNRLILPGGEVSIEANYELRANVNSYIELAIFTDVGNVWFLPGHQGKLEGAQLSKKTILQLGWDVGIGLRFDFDFLIFRLDVAQQLYSPALQDFVVKSFPKDLGGNQFQYNFGIGYPF
jgi:outer membrane protein assembly factor BamA